jgi:hypothetical protein
VITILNHCVHVFIETYREYKKVKSCLSGEGAEEKKVKRVHFEDDIECQGSPPPPPTQSTKEDGGVFGVSLNKKPKKKMNGDFYVGGRREGERKSVWKLRRWSKSRGHHTVMVKEEEQGEGEEGKGREGEQVGEEKDEDMAASGPNNENDKVCRKRTQAYMYTVHEIRNFVNT